MDILPDVVIRTCLIDELQHAITTNCPVIC